MMLIFPRSFLLPIRFIRREIFAHPLTFSPSPTYTAACHCPSPSILRFKSEHSLFLCCFPLIFRLLLWCRREENSAICSRVKGRGRPPGSRRMQNHLKYIWLSFLFTRGKKKQGSADHDHAHETEGKNIKNNPDRALTSGVIRQHRKSILEELSPVTHPLTVLTDFVCLDLLAPSQLACWSS